MGFLSKLLGIDDSSGVKKVITSPFNPKLEVQTKKGAHRYFEKISKLAHSDLCIELANVMSAKHNLMSSPSPLSKFSEKQEKIADLTEKAMLICFHKFGSEIVVNYSGADSTKLNELVNKIDEEIAQKNLNPNEHGEQMLYRLSQELTK